jgi:hypothetical protein
MHDTHDKSNGREMNGHSQTCISYPLPSFIIQHEHEPSFHYHWGDMGAGGCRKVEIHLLCLCASIRTIYFVVAGFCFLFLHGGKLWVGFMLLSASHFLGVDRLLYLYGRRRAVDGKALTASPPHNTHQQHTQRSTPPLKRAHRAGDGQGAGRAA